MIGSRLTRKFRANQDRERASFRTAIEDWMTTADHERYANEPDPWPKVEKILQAA